MLVVGVMVGVVVCYILFDWIDGCVIYEWLIVNDEVVSFGEVVLLLLECLCIVNECVLCSNINLLLCDFVMLWF